ncbi:MAG: NADH-quinone oxidoreductase subunit M [Pseudomonadota bacterium]
MTFDWPLLSVLIWLPIVGGVIVAVLNDSIVRPAALAVAVVTFLLSLLLYTNFDTSTAQMQFVESVPWIDTFNIHYALGADGIAVPLIILTAFITMIVIISAWEVIRDNAAFYMASFLVMTGLMIGVFSALDAILFYVFWEATLIPMFLVIGIWGGPNRVYATIKFFLYTFFGSVFMLVALIYLHFQTGSFSIHDFQMLKIDLDTQILIFIAFLLAFSVKIPMWPVHTWLPDAHVEAPTGGSAVLAAIMLKLGAYGFLRFSLPIAPDASLHLDMLMIALSLIAVVYIGFVALVQSDMKKLIAYSSISHMGFVTLGMFIAFRIMATASGDGDETAISSAVLGLEGAMIQMISHGFISAAMFLCVGVMYDRIHSRQIADYGGVVNSMPVFAAFMVFFAMSNAGLPGTSGFVGEFMVILAAFKAGFWYAFFAATTLILGAAYTLWMVKRVVFGDIVHDSVAKLDDINRREFFFLAMLAVCVLFFGLWPDVISQVMHATIENLLNHILVSKVPA